MTMAPTSTRLADQPRTILVLCAAIAAAHVARLVASDEAQSEALAAFAIIPARFAPSDPFAFTKPFEAVGPLFGHVFLHAGFIHLLFNLMLIVFAGGITAQRFAQAGGGGWRILALFFGAAAASAWAYIAINPGSLTPAIGASGAASGLFAAYLFSPYGDWRLAARDWGLWRQAFWFLAVNVGIAYLARAADVLAIAWEAHLGGFLGGLMLYPLLAPHRGRLA